MSRHPRCRIKAYSGALSVKCSSKAWQSFEEHHGRGLLIDGPVPTFRLGHGLAHARGDRNGQPHNSNPRRNNRGPGKTAGWFTKYREQYKECTELKLRIIMEMHLFSEKRPKKDQVCSKDEFGAQTLVQNLNRGSDFDTAVQNLRPHSVCAGADDWASGDFQDHKVGVLFEPSEPISALLPV